MIDGLYRNFLKKLLLKDMNDNIFIKFMKNYCKEINNKRNRIFPRESLIPFTKWYVKKYHKRYDYSKIYDAIENDTIDKLNKNLKTIAVKFITLLKKENKENT
jgi:hypothetical protein